MEGNGLNQTPETRSAFMLPANVSEAPSAVGAGSEPARAESAPDAAKTAFDTKINEARAEGREKLAAGWLKIKQKMEALKDKIKTLSGPVVELAIKAVVEVFTLETRIDNVIDGLDQKIDAAKEAMERKVAEAREKFEARKIALVTIARETINKIKDRSVGFFSKMRESMFASARKKEQQELLDMLMVFLQQSERGGVTISEAQFKAVTEALVQIGKRHSENSKGLFSFMKSFAGMRGRPAYAGATI